MSKYKYPFTHYLTFALVMNNEKFCRDIIGRIFPDHKVKSLELKNSISLESEKTVISAIESKFIRMDVMFENDENIYDIEMQMQDEGDIPKRSRYAHAMMDVSFLKSGQTFNDLKKSYVVFICNFDFLKTGRAISVFEKYCKKDDIYLEDSCYTVIVNATSSEIDIDPGLRNLFSYMKTQTVPDGDEPLKALDEAVQMHNTGKELTKLMTLEEKINMDKTIAYRKGKAAGIEEGKAAGIEEGKLEIIAAMHKRGISIEEIAEIAG